ncbi:hypothetical protein GGR57DRAFT_121528 [Xylariaceae sp. FL1272]|nr:hypothetical protein GGR57DRAFT_121528 [Xylariaceae sp. FL1272]
MRRLFMSEEELGKKDDDHKPIPGHRRSSSWKPARVPARRSMRRIALLFAAAVLVYFFVANIPVLGPDARMRRPIYPPSEELRPGLPHDAHPHSGAPPVDHALHTPDTVMPPGRLQDVVDGGYNGFVRFPTLAQSLQAIAATKGSQPINQNVLFAASSLKSAAVLLPAACQMGREANNYVHFALLGRSTIHFEQLQRINGIDKTCPVIFHDARPDLATASTEIRLENSVFRGMHHINAYMHPQAIVLDDLGEEDGYFTRGIKRHLVISKTALIEFPSKAARSLSWIAKLDSAALRMWDKFHIEILIQAAPGSAGSLIRLLKSLSAADYTSSAVPHITIDLPYEIETPITRYLESFTWPPLHAPHPNPGRFLSIRHRLSKEHSDGEQVSTRFLEYFWPSHPQRTHVLVLSPQVELSPQYYHYLRYMLLRYRYSSSETFAHRDRQLFGISLELPSLSIDSKQSLTPPLLLDSDTANPDEIGSSTPFLWQAPTSNAMLFLGEKWAELHDFVYRSSETERELHGILTFLSEKIYSKQHPSWLEYALRLSRIRGYWFLHPGADLAQNVAIVHGELYNIPEEYLDENSKNKASEGASDDGFKDMRQKVQSSPEIQLSYTSLLTENLPNKGKLRPLNELPLLTWDGQRTSIDELSSRALALELKFKDEVGRCDPNSPAGLKRQEPLSTADLFCNIYVGI